MAITSFRTSSMSDPKKYNKASGMLGEYLPVSLEYLVIAGGGGGTSSYSQGGGGGAGGYRSSVLGERSGRNSSTETTPAIAPGTYRVSVGAGGANSTQGENSIFYNITSIGGGRGGGGAGGSGGGGNYTNSGTTAGGVGTANQGFDGGRGGGPNQQYRSGAGGGAGAVGNSYGGNGGSGIDSSITGTSVGRAGGGGSTNGNSVIDGGGSRGVAGAANTGGGGGAEIAPGGSGVVILRVPKGMPLKKGTSHTVSISSFASYDVYTFTAGDDDITIG